MNSLLVSGLCSIDAAMAGSALLSLFELQWRSRQCSSGDQAYTEHQACANPPVIPRLHHWPPYQTQLTMPGYMVAMRMTRAGFRPAVITKAGLQSSADHPVCSDDALILARRS